MRHKLGLLLPLLFAGCPPPPEPQIDPDPTHHDDACYRAELRLCALDCQDELGDSLCIGPTGVRFAARCRDEIRRGMGWDAECLATLARCEDVNLAATGVLCETPP